MKEYSRSERMASQIQRDLAGIIRSQLKDPGVVAPSILDVEVSKDLSVAKVYFSVLDPDTAESTLSSLNHAAGFLQREVGRNLKARVTPRLQFIYDDTDIRGRQLSDLIDSVIASDKDRARHDD